MKDYYQVLGLSKTATNKEIKAAYRKLAKLYHPDKNQDSKEAELKFKEIVEAYEILSNTFKRSAYERLKHKAQKSKTAKAEAKAYNKQREEEMLNRFYITIFSWAAKASVFFIIYGLVFSLDLFLPKNTSTEKIDTLIEYVTDQPEGGILPIGGKIPMYYLDADEEKKFEFFVKTEQHRFLAEKDVLLINEFKPTLTIKSTPIFNTVFSVKTSNANQEITLIPKMYDFVNLFPIILILGLLVLAIGFTTKFSVELVMLLFFGNCIATLISFIMLFLEIHVRFYL